MLEFLYNLPGLAKLNNDKLDTVIARLDSLLVKNAHGISKVSHYSGLTAATSADGANTQYHYFDVAITAVANINKTRIEALFAAIKQADAITELASFSASLTSTTNVRIEAYTAANSPHIPYSFQVVEYE